MLNRLNRLSVLLIKLNRLMSKGIIIERRLMPRFIRLNDEFNEIRRKVA